jgi:flagellar hook-length control protein FliK
MKGGEKMIENSTECITSIQTSNKRNFNQRNKGLKSSFDQIFEASREETNRPENNSESKKFYKNTNKVALQQYNRKVVKDKNDENYKTSSNNNQDKDINTDIKKSSADINEEQIDNVNVEENDTSSISDEILQDLIAIDEILSSIISTYLNSEPINYDDEMQQDKAIYNEISSSEAHAMSIKLNDIISSMEPILELLNKSDKNEGLKLIQEIQDIVNIIDNGNLEKLEPSFLNELKSHIDEIMKTAQNLNKSLNITNQNSAEVVNFEDNKTSTKEINVKNDNIKADQDSSKSETRAEYSIDSSNVNRENVDIPRSLSNLVADQSIKPDGQSNELFEAVVSTEKAIKEPIFINKNSIFEQIVDKIKVDHKDIRDEIKIKLKPEILGEMTIKVVVEKGIVTAKAFVESYQIKQLLDSNIEQLRDSFREQGVSFQALDVSVNKDSGFERNSADSWSNNKRNKQRKIKVDDVRLSNMYEEINQQNSSNMNDYSSGLDLIV